MLATSNLYFWKLNLLLGFQNSIHLQALKLMTLYTDSLQLVDVEQ